MKQDKTKDLFLEQLRRVPIIQLACEKTGIARSSIYRWKIEDEDFKKKLEEALVEGETMINEMGETQLISLIKEKSWPAVSFWLRHHHPKYANRIEISTKVPDEKLNPEQEAQVRQALRLAGLAPPEEKIVSEKIEEIINNNNQNEQIQQQANEPTQESKEPTSSDNPTAQ